MKEKIMQAVFTVTACISILCVLLICVFLFANGIPAFGKIGPIAFLTGTVWKPASGSYGILPMILGSIYVTAGAIVIGVPIGVLSAVFMARFCPTRLYGPLHTAVSLMAGIPSVIYGFFGLVILVPVAQSLFGAGKSILTASVMLGIMILPTIINVSETAIRVVPENYYEGSLALGATHERSVFFAVLPAAKSGIMAGVILGIGRSIGETIAVMMVAGNSIKAPDSLFHGVRTLTTNIITEMGYAADLHREALFATGVVLFVFILIINALFSLLKREQPQ